MISVYFWVPAMRLIHYLSRLGYRLIALGGIRAPIRLYMHLSNRNFIPAVVDVPRARNVLVLAPHMDDETIGCGGAILTHVARGAQVEVVFITDGGAGIDKSIYSSQSTEQLRDIRKKEAATACSLLGVFRSHYLDLPDGRSRLTEAAVEQLLAIIEAVQPDVVYLPFITDTHHDHLTTNKLFHAVARRKENISSMLCSCYEVWTPIHPNCIIDISSQMDAKMAALSCYESQLKMNNYLSSVKGLNAYRSITNESKGYAEAFYLTTAGDYLTLDDFAEDSCR